MSNNSNINKEKHRLHAGGVSNSVISCLSANSLEKSEITLELSNNISELDALTDHLERLCHRLSLPRKTIFEIEMIFA